jgi:hypothetical protein
MSVTINGTNGVTFNDGTVQASSAIGKNLIINGDMRINQRGGTITMSTGNYNLDRFFSYTSTDGTQTAEQSTEAPAGFKNSLKVTTTTADSSLAAGQRTAIIHRVEGNNISHLDWGTSDAKSVTLSFWVRSSITGTHGGAIGNGVDNRAYPFTYTISSADTWEYKTITIAGDTTGTWATDTGRSLQISWGLGVGTTYSGTAGAWESADRNSATGATTDVIGTLNATWYLTGVQLEANTTATPFEYLQYGQQLALCQRYYYIPAQGSNSEINVGWYYNSTWVSSVIDMPVPMRVKPTLTDTTGSGYYTIYRDNAADTLDSLTLENSNNNHTCVSIYNNSDVSGTGGQAGILRATNASAKLELDSEL